jgi:mRNA-degrading endonuclease RelE of RelBE toxin-antitoxin system
MPWKVTLTLEAEKQLNKLDTANRERVLELFKRLESMETPTDIGRKMGGTWAGTTRFRAGKIRVICTIFHEILIIEALVIDKRSDVYD